MVYGLHQKGGEEKGLNSAFGTALTDAGAGDTICRQVFQAGVSERVQDYGNGRWEHFIPLPWLQKLTRQEKPGSKGTDTALPWVLPRLLRHIPLRYFRIVRYYGFYSNKGNLPEEYFGRDESEIKEAELQQAESEYENLYFCEHCGRMRVYSHTTVTGGGMTYTVILEHCDIHRKKAAWQQHGIAMPCREQEQWNPMKRKKGELKNEWNTDKSSNETNGVRAWTSHLFLPETAVKNWSSI